MELKNLEAFDKYVEEHEKEIVEHYKTAITNIGDVPSYFREGVFRHETQTPVDKSEIDESIKTDIKVDFELIMGEVEDCYQERYEKYYREELISGDHGSDLNFIRKIAVIRAFLDGAKFFYEGDREEPNRVGVVVQCAYGS